MSIKQILNKYKKKYDVFEEDFKLYITETEKNISIDLILIPTYLREEGIGTKIVEDIIEYSNITGKTICLTPATTKSDQEQFNIDVKRLRKFWDKFGFLKNIGKNKDFEISHSMYMESPEPYTKEMKDLYLLIEETMDIQLLKDFNFKDFYKKLINSFDQVQTKEELEKISIQKMIAEYITTEFDNKHEKINDYAEETTALERFGTLKQFQKLGEGSDRIVYKLNDKYSVKVCRNTRGISQNENEASFSEYQDGKLLPNVYEIGKDYLIVETCTPYKSLDKDNRKRINTLLKPYNKFTQVDWENKEADMQEAFYESNLETYELSDLFNYDLLYGDFKSSRNWGIDNSGNLLMLDGGTMGDPSFLKEKQHTIRRNEIATNNKFNKVIEKLWINKNKLQKNQTETSLRKK